MNYEVKVVACFFVRDAESAAEAREQVSDAIDSIEFDSEAASKAAWTGHEIREPSEAPD
jgi:hypothetical protein